MSDSFLVDMEVYFRKLDSLYSKVKLCNDALGFEYCALVSRRGRGNLLMFGGVVVLAFGHFDLEGVDRALAFMSGADDLSWNLSRDGHIFRDAMETDKR